VVRHRLRPSLPSSAGREPQPTQMLAVASRVRLSPREPRYDGAFRCRVALAPLGLWLCRSRPAQVTGCWCVQIPIARTVEFLPHCPTDVVPVALFRHTSVDPELGLGMVKAATGAPQSRFGSSFRRGTGGGAKSTGKRDEWSRLRTKLSRHETPAPQGLETLEVIQ